MGHTSSSQTKGYQRVSEDYKHVFKDPEAKDLKTKITTTNPDPLVLPTLRNLAECPVYRLPEEVLLNIILHLPSLEDEAHLRISCRLFLRLYNTSAALPVHEAPKTAGRVRGFEGFITRRLAWEYHGLTTPRRFVKGKSATYLCKGCTAAWKAKDWKQREDEAFKYYHCSGCGVDHRAWLFSAAQRRVSSELRVCIGHQGYLRLCDHKTVTWADIVARAGLLDSANPVPAHIRQDMAVCKHRSHDTGGRLPSKIRHNTRGCSVSLSLAPSYRRSKEHSRRQELALMWDAYIPDIIPPKRPDDDGSQPKARIDGTMLHRQLASLRDITGKYMFSDPLYDPSAGKPPLEASCFDPGYCDCIHLAGSEDLPQHLKLAEPERKTSWKEWQGGQHSCSTSALSDNFPLHLRRSPYHPGPTFIQTVSVYSPPEFPGALCVEYNSSFDISFDDDPAKTLQLRRSGPLGRCSLEWMMALDPESYDIESDHEGLNVFWCRQPECANYFRSITRLGSDDDHTKPCPRLCH